MGLSLLRLVNDLIWIFLALYFIQNSLASRKIGSFFIYDSSSPRNELRVGMN